MLKQWPNIRNEDKPGKRCFASGEEAFWARNWCQHGAVKERFQSSVEYFRKSSKLISKIRTHPY